MSALGGLRALLPVGLGDDGLPPATIAAAASAAGDGWCGSARDSDPLCRY